jgi:hypothetical protein
MGIGNIFRGIIRPGVKKNTHSDLAPRLILSGAVPKFPVYVPSLPLRSALKLWTFANSDAKYGRIFFYDNAGQFMCNPMEQFTLFHVPCK